MPRLRREHNPRLARLVGTGLLMIVAGVVGARVGGIAWPALVAAGNLLAIVGVVVFFAAGFLYTIQFIRGLLTDWGSNE